MANSYVCRSYRGKTGRGTFLPLTPTPVPLPPSLTGLNIKSCSCEKRLFVKLVLALDDEILNTTETSHLNKKENNSLFTLFH